MHTIHYQNLNSIVKDPSAYRRKYLSESTGFVADIQSRLIQDLILFPDLVSDKYILNVAPPENADVRRYLEDYSYHVRHKMNSAGEISTDTLTLIKGNILRQMRIEGDDVQPFLAAAEKEMKYFEFLIAVKGRVKIEKDVFEEGKTLSETHEYFLTEVLRKNQIASLNSIAANPFKSAISLPSDDDGKLLPTNFTNEVVSIYNHLTSLFSYQLNSKILGNRKSLTISSYINQICFNKDEKTLEIVILKKFDNVLAFAEYFKTSDERLNLGINLLIIKQLFPEFVVSCKYAVYDESQAYSFPVSLVTQTEIIKEAIRALDIYHYHNSTKKYNMPYKYLINEIQL